MKRNFASNYNTTFLLKFERGACTVYLSVDLFRPNSLAIHFGAKTNCFNIFDTIIKLFMCY